MNSVFDDFRVRPLFFGSVAVFLLVFVAGCDTIARIPFPERSLEEIHSSGFINPAGSCGGTNGSSGEVKLRFAMADESNEPIWPGEQLSEDSVEMTAQSIQFSNASIYENANGICSSGDCSATGFSCQAPPDNQGQPPNRCIASTNLGVSNPQFVSKDAPQFFGVVMENSGSLQGWVANDLAKNRPYDYCTDTGNGCECENSDQPCTPDGTTDSQRLSSQLSQIATDSDFNRVAQLRSMRTALASVADKARREDGRQTFFGLWSFSEEQTRSYFDPENSNETVGWTSNIGGESGRRFNAAVDAFNSDASDINQTRANIYEAAVSIINDYYGNSHLNQFTRQSQNTDPEKVLTLVVDGPDDLREQDNTTIQNLIDAASEKNIRVFVLHLDPTMPNKRLIRDDPTYYRQQSTCSDDSECKNFETCRKPKRYGAPGSSVGEPVEEPSLGNSDATYCLPTRGPDGRIGPINDFSRLACETGGGYLYLTNTDTEQSGRAANGLTQLRWMPYTIDGLWETTVSSNRISRGNVPSNTFIRIGSQMQLSVAGQSQTYSFSQAASISASEPFDTRSVVKTK